VQSNLAQRRRLDSYLVVIFHRACASKNLDAAADLLTVLENGMRKRGARYGRERRISDAEITATHVGLERLTGRWIS
jgi:hypothetical protein